MRLFLNIMRVDKSELAKKEQEYYQAYTERIFYGNTSIYKYLIEDLEKSGDWIISIPCYLYNSLTRKETNK